MHPILFKLLVCFVLSFACSANVFADYPAAYVGKAELRDIAVSPDGTALVLLKTGHQDDIVQKFGWDEIMVEDSATGDTRLEIKQTYTYYSKSVNWLYDWVSWPFDDTILSSAVEFTVSGDKFKSRSVFLTINPETGEKKVLAASRKRNLDKELDSPKLIASDAERREVTLAIHKKASVELVSINVDTGRQRLLDTANSRTLTWLLDDSMRPVMRIEKSKSGGLHQYYSSQDGGRNWTLRFQHDPLNEGFYPVSYSSKNNKFIVVSRPADAEHAGLYEFDLHTGQFGKQLFSDSEYDLSSARKRRGSDDLLYSALWKDKLEKHWFTPEDAKLGRAIDSALPDEANWSVFDMSLHGQAWVIYVSSPINPGAYYVLRNDLKRLRKISDARPHIDLSTTSMPRRVDYQTSEGLALRGYFTPSTRSPGHAPLIVMPHGGPVSRDVMDWDGWAQYFAHRGYAVFQPQFRGSGGFGQTFERLGHGEWGRAMQQDIADGVHALEQAGLVSPDQPRSIVGASYGGYAALAAATMTPDAYQCAISYAGVSDLPRMLRQYDPSDAVDAFVRNIWTQRMNNGRDDETELWHRSPISYIEYLKAPVFLIHGTEDEIVHMDQTTAFYDAAVQAGKQAQILLLDHTGHQIYSDDTNTDLLVAMNTFLVQCMPPAPKTPTTNGANLP